MTPAPLEPHDGLTRAADPRAGLEATGPEELEAQARATLTRECYDFVAGGAGGELTLRANRAAFDAVRLVPRVLRGAAAPVGSSVLLGAQLAMPVFVAPMAAHGLVHPEAELGSARGAAAAGALFVAPTLANRSLEEIATAAGDGPHWFELRPRRDAGRTRELVRRAEAAGYRAIVLTVDQPVDGLRERDRRNRFRFPSSLAFPNLPSSGAGGARDVDAVVADAQPSLTWADYERIRAWSTLPLVVKGILAPGDAEEAAWREVPAIVVSNHGGRQLDGALATLDALPEIVERVRGRTEVLLDGGVRRGVDVVKALALGASAVGVGRPVLWALAVGGGDGVAAMLRGLHAELLNALALVGVTDPRDLTPEHVR